VRGRREGWVRRKIGQLSDGAKYPATLFIGGKWIDANKNTFLDLAKNDNFEIEDHGTEHVPCSVNGKSAYGIGGTKNISEMIDEMDLDGQKIQGLTGRKPKFYRAGTVYTDEVCPQVAGELGYQVVSFNVLGDAGATYPADKIRSVLLNAKPGSIALLHMNHPEKETAEGIMAAIPELRKEGWRFVKLGDYDLK
jgi:peptidoglycan/xylan/chitin deacetylase (PgdA/CDA1 family)